MKKNITVNMFGVLYSMDEDAYELLNSYFDNMRSYFASREGGDEIADDIEARVAELMNDLLAAGANAISMEDVRDIITRVGNPEEMCGGLDDFSASGAGDAAVDGEPQATGKKVKKLYRDVDYKILGGVFSGFGCYFGINPLWLRLAAVILGFVSYGVVFVIYLIAWALIPPAVTPAQRLEMKGDPVNLGNIRDEIMSGTRMAVNSRASRSIASGASKALVHLLRVAAYLMGLAVVAASGVGLIALLASVVWVLFVPSQSMAIDSAFIPHIYSILPPWMVVLTAVSAIVVLVIPLIAGVHTLSRVSRGGRSMSAVAVWVCIIGWILAMACCIGVGATVGTEVSKTEQLHHRQMMERRATRQTEMLASSGWKLVKSVNVNSSYFGCGEHYSGETKIWYPEAGNNDAMMIYEIERGVKVAPGRYTLEAVSRTDGNGCEIFAVNGAGERFAAPVPVCGRSGGSVWATAKEAVENDSLPEVDRERLKRMFEVHGKKGYGWSRVRIDGVTVGSDSLLTYGVTNDSPVRTWDGSTLSATSFELIRTE